MDDILFNILFNQSFSLGALGTILSIKRIYPKSIININYKNVIDSQIKIFQQFGCRINKIPNSIMDTYEDIKRYKPISILNLEKLYDLSVINKIIQIDADFILTGDINKMINTPNNFICGCKNDVITKYINTGLVVFNFKYFKNNIIAWKNLINKQPNLFQHYNWTDQGHFNMVIEKKNIKLFDTKIYNLFQLKNKRYGKYPNIYLNDQQKQKGIHFTGKNKPWKSSCHSYQTFYRKYFYKLLLDFNINILDISQDFHNEIYKKHFQQHNKEQIAFNTIIAYSKQFKKNKLNIYSDIQLDVIKYSEMDINVCKTDNKYDIILLFKKWENMQKLYSRLNRQGVLLSFAPKEKYQLFYNQVNAWNMYDRWYCFKKNLIKNEKNINN